MNKFKDLVKESLNREIMKPDEARNLLLKPFIRPYSKRILGHLDWDSALSFPPIIQVENTNLCNTNCIMCPRDEMRRKKGVIDISVFRKIIDDVVNGFGQTPGSVTLGGFGEPLADRNFVEEVKYCKAKGLKVETFTNASLLDPSVSNEIVGKVDVLYVSLDSVSEKTYKTVRPKLDFRQVEDNIMYLLELKKEQKADLPKVVVGTHELKEVREEIPLFIRKWKGLADEVTVSTVHEWSLKKGWLEGVGFSTPQAKRRAPCMRLWNFLNVLWTGEVNICCSDFDGSEIIGDAGKSSVLEIWQGERYRELREIHLKREFYRVDICAKCNQWKYAPDVQPWWWDNYLRLNQDVEYPRKK